MKVIIVILMISLKLILIIKSEKAKCSELSLFLKTYINHIEPAVYNIEGFFCYKPEKLVRLHKCLDESIQKFNKIEKIENVIDNLTKNNKILFIVDLKCPNVNKHLENEKIQFFYKQPNLWLLLDDNNNDDENRSMSSLPDIQSLPDSNIMLAEKQIKHKIGNNVNNVDEYYDEIRLKQFYKIESNSSSIIFEPYGKWSLENGLIITQNNTIISRRRRNLHGKILTASIVLQHNESIHHLDDYRDRHIDPISKVNYILVKYLIESLNSTKNFNFVNTWGYKDPKSGKILYGMLFDLEDKRADIGGTPLFMTVERIPKIQYLSMTTFTRAKFIFREPPLSYVTNIYSLPFTSFVWISSLSLVILCILVILVTTRFETKLKTQAQTTENVDIISKKNVRITDYIIMGIGAICQMGTTNQPKIASTRISTIFLLISLLFFYTSYTANIVALLQSTTKSIQTLKDLLGSSIELSAEDTSYHRYYFPISTDPIRKDIYKRKFLIRKDNERFMNATTGIDRVRKELFAFHIELGIGYKIIKDTFYEHEKCNLMTIEFLEVIEPWLATQKYSPYNEMFKVNLFKIREHGLQLRERSKIYADKPQCSSKGQNFGSVRLTDCYAAIVIFLIGCGLSIILLFFERFFINNNHKLCLM